MAWYSVLADLGMTPEEWGALDPVQQRFLESAHQERNKRQNSER